MTTISLVLTLLCVGIESAWAFNQPPVNLGLTSALDVGPAPPGFYLVEYAQLSNGGPAADKDGRTISGGAQVATVVNVNQLFYLSPINIAGAYLGFDFVQPLVAVTAKGSIGAVPITANTAGLGDFVFGPALQWNNSTVFDRPYFHRFEVDITLPTGKYDLRFTANPGSNIVTVEPYYAFTYMLSKYWETSWRFFYAFHGRNPATHVQPGQLFHFNYAFTREIRSGWRLGASGYLLQQVNDDTVAGATSPDSKEFAHALGPSLAYVGQGLALMLSYPIESISENRFKTSRITLQLIHGF